MLAVRYAYRISAEIYWLLGRIIGHKVNPQMLREWFMRERFKYLGV
jgi:hypothetical protein